MIARTEDGKEIRIKSVAIQPFFTTDKGQAGVVLGKACDSGGTAVDTFALVASGTNGKVTKGERPSAKGAVPLIDQKAKKKAEKKAAEDAKAEPAASE
jgi:hypothetical protein